MTVVDEIARDFLLERFDDFLSVEQGAAGTTSEAYHRDLSRFATYARVQGAAQPSAVTPAMLRSYIYHLKDVGLAPSSIRRNISAMRTYYRFLIGEGEVVKDPTERLETP
ncbi:MAG: site-specific integrase, partial [Gemmatimonadota bacterium]|nr:site-specific integrase [Gemmatimonadota bacterium]